MYIGKNFLQRENAKSESSKSYLGRENEEEPEVGVVCRGRCTRVWYEDRTGLSWGLGDEPTARGSEQSGDILSVLVKNLDLIPKAL